MNKFYDIDLPFGEIFEEKLKYIFGNKKFEVKTERDIWKKTGNFIIELKFKKEKSGLNVTKADYWCHIFSDDGQIIMMMIFLVYILKQRIDSLIKDGIAKIEYGGDNNDSLVAIVPIKSMFDIKNIGDKKKC